MQGETKWFYPYCGYELGFCNYGDTCPMSLEDMTDKEHIGCPHLLKEHPLTKLEPQELCMEEVEEDYDFY